MLVYEQLLQKKLVDADVVPQHVFDAAKREAGKNNEDITQILMRDGVVTEDQLGRLFADAYQVPYVHFARTRIHADVASKVPEPVARARGIVAFAKDDEGVHVAMSNPSDLEVRSLVEKRFSEPLVVHYATPKGIREALSVYTAGLDRVLQVMIRTVEVPSIAREQHDQLIIQIADTLLNYGFENRASDVHIEPFEKDSKVRFRIDGVLHDVLALSPNVYDAMLTRIKVLSKMRTDEHRAAQNGKFRFVSRDEHVDALVSIVPTMHGENIVIRLLSSEARSYELPTIGMGTADMRKLEQAMKMPRGMILVTGPTGSGKTTTLYAVLRVLNKRGVNIATIEDPVEYDIAGVTQMQVNTQTDLTFANGLRSIVRQDPDIIMVGEIRDEETAGIAVNAAMTGHAVLSTLHANDAATTLSRLLDMGIEPLLIASTVNIVVAQRLVRTICENCRAWAMLTEQERHVVDLHPQLKAYMAAHGYVDIDAVRLYRGEGCHVCENTGYSGRTGVYEVLEMSQAIKDLVLRRAPSSDIADAARVQGMTMMFEDGMQKVFAGITSLSEVLRVT